MRRSPFEDISDKAWSYAWEIAEEGLDRDPTDEEVLEAYYEMWNTSHDGSF